MSSCLRSKESRSSPPTICSVSSESYSLTLLLINFLAEASGLSKTLLLWLLLEGLPCCEEGDKSWGCHCFSFSVNILSFIPSCLALNYNCLQLATPCSEWLVKGAAFSSISYSNTPSKSLEGSLFIVSNLDLDVFKAVTDGDSCCRVLIWDLLVYDLSPLVGLCNPIGPFLAVFLPNLEMNYFLVSGS